MENTLKQVIALLRTKWKLGCVYHPQSEGIVEWVNGKLKAKIAKVCSHMGLNWVDALPLALMAYCTQIHSKTQGK